MASSIVSSIGKQVGSLLVEEGKYLYEVRKKAEKLQRELQWMGCFLQDADNKEHQDQLVKQWIADIRDIAYEAEDIIERYVHGISHHREGGIQNIMKRFSCFICDAWDLHNVGSYIDELRTSITELTTRLATYGIQSVNQPQNSAYDAVVRERRRTYLCEDQHVIELEKETEDVVDALVNEEFPLAGVCGMGGLGKTTFAKKIVRNARVQEHFSRCAWVYVSQKVDRREVFEEILKGLGYKPAYVEEKVKDVSEQKLVEEMCKILAKGSCLVVLDDIWALNDWKLLEPAFGTILRASSSKLLLTTRNEELPKQADPRAYSINLRFFDEEEAWTLLNKKLTFLRGQDEDVVVDGEMEKLGRQMIENCKGLPLAIVALAGILATKKTVKEWEEVQDRTSIINEDVSSVLELSFYELPFYLKPCFMYLGHFPEDYEIEAVTLYALWEAEGIVAVENQEASHIETAERYLNELVHRSMVLVDKYWETGRIRSCRLHDVMRYICLKKCREVNFLTTMGDPDNPTSQFGSSYLESKRMRRCAIQAGDGSCASSLFCQHKRDTYYLRSLLVLPLGKLSKFKISPSQLTSLSVLRVLGLRDAWIDSKTTKAIGELIHLKYLSFEDSYIRELPSCIFHLRFLETLDLRVKTLDLQAKSWPDPLRIPNKLSKLERLRHLYLPSVFRVIPEGSEKRFIEVSDSQSSQMETLINYEPYQCRMNLRKATNLRNFSLTPIMTFTIDDEECRNILESPLITSGRLMNSIELDIYASLINEEPTILTSSKVQAHIRYLRISGKLEVDFNLHGLFPRDLVVLGLVNGFCNEGISHLEKFPCLEDLYLSGKWGQKEMIFPDGSFPWLVNLELTAICNLEKWEVGKGALPRLRDLYLVLNTRLQMVPQNLPSTVKITSCSFINGIEKYSYTLDAK